MTKENLHSGQISSANLTFRKRH